MFIVNTEEQRILVKNGTTDQELYNGLKLAWRETDEYRKYHFPVKAVPIIFKGERTFYLMVVDGWDVQFY